MPVEVTSRVMVIGSLLVEEDATGGLETGVMFVDDARDVREGTLETGVLTLYEDATTEEDGTDATGGVDTAELTLEAGVLSIGTTVMTETPGP